MTSSDDKRKKIDLGYYMIPLTLIDEITEKPEVALLLLIKLYQQQFPDADIEKIYDAIYDYLGRVEFNHDKEVILAPAKKDIN